MEINPQHIDVSGWDCNKMILDKAFYQREDATVVAKELLGKVLITEFNGIKTAGIIVETEAYMGPEDLACHAHSNRRTPRTEVMYHKGGLSYVYICYGMHHLFNTVTGEEGMAHAVLIRALQPLHNESSMMSRRGFAKMKYELLNGPGKLSQALGITSRDNGIDITADDSTIKIIDVALDITKHQIDEGPRVGMSHHTKHCGYYPWRYKIKDNKWTSKPDKVSYNW